MHFEISDADGTLVPGSPRDAITDCGVADGSFVIPDELAPGRYTLVARSPDNAFPAALRTFLVSNRRSISGGTRAAPRPIGKTDVASPKNHVLLTAAPGVFAAGAPLQFHVRADKAGLPLVVAAYCRGAEVWQQQFESGIGDNLVTAPLDEAIGGVIRAWWSTTTASPRPNRWLNGSSIAGQGAG